MADIIDNYPGASCPVALIEIEEIDIEEGAGIIAHIRGYFEIEDADSEGFCVEVEAKGARGHWHRIPESNPLRQFIIDQVNGPQKIHVIDAITEARAEIFPDNGEYEKDPYQATGWSNPHSPVVL